MVQLEDRGNLDAQCIDPKAPPLIDRVQRLELTLLIEGRAPLSTQA